MGDVDTNNTSIAATQESALGVPGTRYHLLEVNGEPTLRPDLTKITRNPIRKDRNAAKGTVVDLDAPAKLSLDITSEHLRLFVEAAFMATAAGLAQFTQCNALGPTAVTATGYTVPSGGAIAAGLLVVASGFAVAANNGLKLVGASSTSTEVKTTGLTAETVAATVNASLEICGVRGASGDITINASKYLTSTALVLTGLGLTVGQWVRIGGDATANQFATAANNSYARISIIAASLLTFDRWVGTFAADTGTGKLIDIYFGTFHRNVSVDSASWLKRSYTLELAYENLGAAAADAYRYAYGQIINTVVFDYPLTSKATMDVDFVGTTIGAATETRLSGGSAAIQPVLTDLYNTADQIDEIGLCTSNTTQTAIVSSFNSVKITLSNNANGQRKMGTLGAAKINIGRMDVKAEISAWLDGTGAYAAALANTTVQFYMAARNGQGGHFWDLPACTIDSPDESFPENATVLQALTLQPFKDPTLGYSASLSRFPFLPST